MAMLPSLAATDRILRPCSTSTIEAMSAANNLNLMFPEL
jgi:hypothetical protein